MPRLKKSDMPSLPYQLQADLVLYDLHDAAEYREVGPAGSGRKLLYLMGAVDALRAANLDGLADQIAREYRILRAPTKEG